MTGALTTTGATQTPTTDHQPTMAHLETLEAKMASIEVSLSSSCPRRRKSGCGSVVSGSASVRSSPRPETTATPAKELRSALQDREAVIQNLRVQLGLGKLPRPSGTPLEDSERPAAEQKLHRLKTDVENKRIAIRNLKTALDKLDITDNIDVRIRQAELEYALGREELQLLSLVEEVQALQSRLEKSKSELHSLYHLILTGVNVSLHAVNATVGRWAAVSVTEVGGLFIEWALEGEGLFRGDRIIEVNGKMVCGKSKDELQRLLGSSGKCQIVVARQKSSPIIQQQQLIQSQEDNMRLQHRISYLEEQVKELQDAKEIGTENNHKNSHVTSISISSPPVTPPDKTEIFQRGNFITTIVGGKPLRSPPPPPQISSSSSTSSNTSASSQSQPQSIMKNSSSQHYQHRNQNQNVTKTIIKENGHQSDHKHHVLHQLEHQQKLTNGSKYGMSVSQMSINSDVTYKKERDRREREKELRREIRERFIQNHHKNRLNNGGSLVYSRSGDQLNCLSSDKRREILLEMSRRNATNTINDLRSVKSLDFDSDYGGSATEGRAKAHSKEVDYTSEPHGPRSARPMPPKKPLRLSLQRATSLQTVDGDLDKKKGMKRTYRGDKTPELSQFIEHSSNISLHTASLGRHKYV